MKAFNPLNASTYINILKTHHKGLYEPTEAYYFKVM